MNRSSDYNLIPPQSFGEDYRVGDRFEVLHNSVGVFLFKFAVMVQQLLGIVVEFGGYLMSNFAYPSDAGVFLINHNLYRLKESQS